MRKNLTNYHELLHLAEATALLAGRQLREHQSQWAKIVVEEDRDIKVAADKFAEDLILSQLKSNTPYSILTEETGWHSGTNGETIWIVDPLDGSFNYSHNIPFCGVAIALVEKGEPRLGVIYDFNHDESFSGIVGEGAWLNTEPMQVSNIQNTQAGVLNTGFPARANYPKAIAEMLENGQKFRKVRMLGSAAISLAYVAAGRSEAYHEQGTMFWDVAAGCALVKAAGGQYQLQGDIFKEPLIAVATNGQIDFL